MPSTGYVQSLKNRFFIKQNNTLPTLEVSLVDRGCLGNKIPFDLSAVTACTFTMTNNCGEMKIINKEANVLSSSGGTISYNWSSEDTNESGMFYGEFKLSFSGGSLMSIPQIGNIIIEIGKSLNPF